MNYCGSLEEYSHTGMCDHHIGNNDLNHGIQGVLQSDGVDATPGIKRDSNGTIDYAHYSKVSRSLRSDAVVDFLKGLLRLG